MHLLSKISTNAVQMCGSFGNLECTVFKVKYHLFVLCYLIYFNVPVCGGTFNLSKSWEFGGMPYKNRIGVYCCKGCYAVIRVGCCCLSLLSSITMSFGELKGWVSGWVCGIFLLAYHFH